MYVENLARPVRGLWRQATCSQVEGRKQRGENVFKTI
jgi:hypothetical protein